MLNRRHGLLSKDAPQAIKSTDPCEKLHEFLRKGKPIFWLFIQIDVANATVEPHLDMFCLCVAVYNAATLIMQKLPCCLRFFVQRPENRSTVRPQYMAQRSVPSVLLVLVAPRTSHCFKTDLNYETNGRCGVVSSVLSVHFSVALVCKNKSGSY